MLGAFSGDDRIITFLQSGAYRLTSFDLTTHFDEDMIRIEKFRPETIWSVVYQESKSKIYYLKRFTADQTDRRVEFMDPADKLILLTKTREPQIELQYDMKQKSKGSEGEVIAVTAFIGVKGVKAKGKRLSPYPVKKLDWLLPEEEETVDEEQDELLPEEVEPEIIPKPKPNPKPVKAPVRPDKKEPTMKPSGKGRKKGKGGQMELPL